MTLNVLYYGEYLSENGQNRENAGLSNVGLQRFQGATAISLSSCTQALNEQLH